MRTPALILHSVVRKLRTEAPIADQWPHDGSGYYIRKVPKNPRPMGFIYAHIHCAPMLLWLAEVAGVRTAQVHKADRTLRRLVRDGLHDSNPACGRAVRAIIPWTDIEAALIRAGHLDKDGRVVRSSHQR